MTPLAHTIMREIADRDPMNDEQSEFAKRLYDFHCFDLTDVHEMISEMAWDICEGRTPLDCADTFLPAERTWIEWLSSSDNSRQRCAVFLEEGEANIRVTPVFDAVDVDTPDDAASAQDIRLDEANWWHYELGNLPRLRTVPVIANPQHVDLDKASQGEASKALDDHERAFVAVALALINSPKLVGRRIHMPHRGLQKRLLNARGNIGEFPLHAWTEIKLSISPPIDVSEEPSVEAHLTGAKAMHFCRAHMRVRLGRLEVVRGHWRGDPSLGIKRSRYRVAA